VSRRQPRAESLLRLRDAGIWILYPWLLLRVLIYLPCWLIGLWLAFALMLLCWSLFLIKLQSSRHLFQFVITTWLFPD
jgi:hypothetical protein